MSIHAWVAEAFAFLQRRSQWRKQAYPLRIVEVARREVGVIQVGGNNRGPRVEEYLASVGARPGQSWCMATVFWIADTAAGDGAKTRVPRTGGAVKSWVTAQATGLQWLHPEDAERQQVDLAGWVIVWTRDPARVAAARNQRLPPDRRWTSGHAGICTHSDWDTRTLYTIEGNTSPGRGFEANGTGVWAKTTTPDDARIVGFYRPEIDYAK